MSMKIFVAGASGALGRPLIGALREAGHDVWGMASRPDSLKTLEQLGAQPVMGDAFDREAVFNLIDRIRPDVVIDQLTSLPASPFELAQRIPADCKLRLEGGGHVFEAARQLGVKRYVQQLSAFYLESEGALAGETAPLRVNAPGTIGMSSRMYAALEARLATAEAMETVGLRYGFFYGPGTWYWPNGAFSRHLLQGDVSLIGAGTGVFSFIHVEDAVQATVNALTAPAGIYNIVDSQPSRLSDWLPAYAAWIGAREVPRLDESTALNTLGEEAVYYQNRLTGACCRKARQSLGLSPRPLPWLSAHAPGGS